MVGFHSSGNHALRVSQCFAARRGLNTRWKTCLQRRVCTYVSCSTLGRSEPTERYVEHVEVHPANQAEVNKPPAIVDALVEQGIRPEGVLAEKGYASTANRDCLKAKGVGGLIQFKGSRGNLVHPLQTQMNRAIATLRYKVEQGFGTMKRRFHLSRARYFGAAKTQAQMA